MKSFHKILHTLVILLMTVTLFSLPVCAKTTHTVSYAQSGYNGNEADVFTPENSSDTRRLDMTAPWDFLGDAMYVKQHIENGSCTAYTILDTEECSGELTFTLEMADDLSPYRMLCFGIGVTARSASPSPIKVELELADYGGNRAVSQLYLPIAGGENTERGIRCWNMLYFDLSDFEGRNDTALLTVRLTYSPDTPPNVIHITNPYAAKEDDGGFGYAETYLTNELTAVTGKFSTRSGTAQPDSHGQLQLTGSFVLGEQPKNGSEAFLEIKMSKITSGGLTVGVGFENGTSADVSRIILTGDETGTEVVTVPIKITDRLQTMSLNFDSVVCDTNFRIESIRLHSEGTVEVTGNPGFGKVTSLTRTADSVVFSGEMDRNIVREYGDAMLCFYAVPGWTREDLDTAVELGRMKVTNRFEYTANLSAYPYLADTYCFYAGLVTADGQKLPLSAPVYTDAAAISEQVLSNVGLYNAAPVGVFESNVSHVIVDVPLDRLLTNPNAAGGKSSASLSYTVYSTGADRSGEAIQRAERPTGNILRETDGTNVIHSRTAQTPVNHALLQELDSEINFYISAGIEVYLRITSETAIPGLTYEGEGASQYSVSLKSTDARYFYTAVVRFLCRRYSGIGGFVIGEAVNVGSMTGGGVSAEDAAAYARELAELCRLTYNAASAEIPDILTILPFAEEKNAGAFGSLNLRTLSVMMVSALEKMGTVPWVMMYCTGDIADILSVEAIAGETLSGETKLTDSGSPAQLTRKFLDGLDLESSAAVMYCYEPEYEVTMYGFTNTPSMTVYNEYLAEMFVKLCGSTRARAVFLSLDRLNDHLEHEFYSYLKTAGDDPTAANSSAGQTTLRSVTDYPAVPADSAADALANTVSQTAVWDFTDKFHPLGWIAGGGVSSCLTVYSDLFSESADITGDSGRYARVLRSIVSLDEDSRSPERDGIAAGIALRNLTRTVDLSEVDYLEFTFALNHPGMIMGTGHETGTVVFVIGSDDCRAEFEVQNAAASQVLKYVCDLSDYEFRDRVSYMGIMVYSDHEVYLDLSSVKAYSNTLPQDKLTALFSASAQEAGAAVDYAAVALVSAVVFVLSVTAAVLLIRHDAEERRERQRRLREEKRPRRERIRRI